MTILSNIERWQKFSRSKTFRIDKFRILYQSESDILGYMSSSGVADCSRAARLILKDVVSGKVKWVAAPPDVDQKEFDKLTYNVARGADFSKTKQYSGVMQQVKFYYLKQQWSEGLLVEVPAVFPISCLNLAVKPCFARLKGGALFFWLAAKLKIFALLCYLNLLK